MMDEPDNMMETELLPRRRGYMRIFLAITVLLLTATVGGLVSLVTPSEEAVKIRNSLIAVAGGESDFSWSPANVPESFLWEKSPPPKEFQDIARRILGAEVSSARRDAFRRSIEIAAHLVQQPRRGGAIMSSTRKTYQKIINTGRGYCADFTQVFNAIALAAHIPVREWGLAFDGFGAGHAVNEIFDEALNKWIMLDVFNSLYIEDAATGIPLSVLEFSEALRTDAAKENVRVVPIVEQRFGFKSADGAIDYYSRGTDQFFLWWGNNVYSYDEHWLVKLLGPVSRSLEQGAAILAGVHPKIHIVSTSSNGASIDEFLFRKKVFFILVFFAIVWALLLLWLVKKYYDYFGARLRSEGRVAPKVEA